MDATCPYVKKIHRVVAGQCAEGRQVIIVGDESHPEVIGIKGWGNQDTKVIENAEDFEKLGLPEGSACAWWPRRTFKLQEISRYS